MYACAEPSSGRHEGASDDDALPTSLASRQVKVRLTIMKSCAPPSNSQARRPAQTQLWARLPRFAELAHAAALQRATKLHSDPLMGHQLWIRQCSDEPVELATVQRYGPAWLDSQFGARRTHSARGCTGGCRMVECLNRRFQMATRLETAQDYLPVCSATVRSSAERVAEKSASLKAAQNLADH